VHAPLEDLPPAPAITMTALKKAVRKLDVCAAAGPDGMPVLHLSGLMRSTAGDGGVEKGAKALLGFLQVLRTATSPVRCALLWHGQACLHPQERGERRRRRVEASGCRYGSS
jgi:hypothetical protein